MRHTLPTRALREKNNSPKNQNEGISQMVVNSRSAQSTFHAIFTSFQRHEIIKQSVFKQAKDVIKSTKIEKIPDLPRRNHIIQKNLEIASWSKQVQVKTPSHVYDDNVGEDPLSSQSKVVNIFTGHRH